MKTVIAAETQGNEMGEDSGLMGSTYLPLNFAVNLKLL